jgi:hypothetical protein
MAFPVFVLSGSDLSRWGAKCDLSELLMQNSEKNGVSRTILKVNNSLFMLLTAPMQDKAHLSIEEVVGQFRTFTASKLPLICLAYSQAANEQGDKLGQQGAETPPTVACFGVMSKLSEMASVESVLSLQERRVLDDWMINHGPLKKRTNLFKSATRIAMQHSYKIARWQIRGAIGLAVLVVIILLFTFPIPYPGGSEFWLRYDTIGSIGPKYQLNLRYPNVSDWAAKNFKSPEQWSIRIDDQAIIPADLMDDEEMRYQRWFQKRYPEKFRVVQRQDYVKEEFLSDWHQIQVPSDKTFHNAHCVLAFRRYWKAKETGHHVCPRDIDYKHMKHCLDSLDEWAFPDGERESINVVEEPGHWVLFWQTKVCF